MATYKLFGEQPHSHDAEFYVDREVANHLHQIGHRERLLRTVADVQYVMDIDPVGAPQCVTWVGGDGGLLSMVALRNPESIVWGYDLSPKAVEYAQKQRGLNVQLMDFVNEKPTLGAVVVLTETLEHLVDPKAMLEKVARRSRWVVATVPSNEDDKRHYEHHLWAWTEQDFPNMFKSLGYDIITHYSLNFTAGLASQVVIARNQ
jgi:hypothetical protein